MANEEAHSFNIEHDFLDDRKQYVAEIYQDSGVTDWESDPYCFVTESKEDSAGDRLLFELAPGCGQSILFRVVEN